MTIVMKKEFGPMLKAERRAFSGGGVLRPGSTPAADTNMDSLQPIEGKPRRWYNAGVPVLSVTGVALYGFYTTGRASPAPGESGLTMIIGTGAPSAAPP